MPNRFQPIPANTEASQQAAIINNNFAQLDNESVTKLFYDVNGIPSISIGVQQDKTSRIRIAKDGIDVTRATDDQLAFNSAQNTLKVVRKLTVSTPAPPTASTGTPGQVFESAQSIIPHGLGYKPVVVSFVDIISSGSNAPVPFTFWRSNVSWNGFQYWNVSTDNLNVYLDTYISLWGTTAVGNISLDNTPATVTIYLLQETAN